jgi:hypothetical protein
MTTPDQCRSRLEMSTAKCQFCSHFGTFRVDRGEIWRGIRVVLTLLQETPTDNAARIRQSNANALVSEYVMTFSRTFRVDRVVAVGGDRLVRIMLAVQKGPFNIFAPQDQSSLLRPSSQLPHERSHLSETGP